MGNNVGLMGAIGVLAVFQLFAAIRVMKAAAESGLTGMGRLMPAVLTLCIPVLGPLVGGRSSGAGMRPVTFSIFGCALAATIYLLLGPQPGARPRVQMAGQTGKSGEAATTADAKAAEAKAGDAKAGDAKAADGPAATPAAETKVAEAPVKSAEPAAAPEAAKPAPPVARPAPQPVSKPTPAPAPQPLATTAPVLPENPRQPVPTVAPGGGLLQPRLPGLPLGRPLPAGRRVPSGPGAALTALTAAGDLQATAAPTAATVASLMQRRVQVEGQLLLPGQRGAGSYLEQHLSETPVNNTRLVFAASYSAPPRSFVAPQLYLGGKVYYFNDIVDYFPAYGMPATSVTTGQSVSLISAYGNFLAEVRFTEVSKDDAGEITSAALDVRIR
ncbi:MAG: hypothetical protein IT204_01545 [Fimbriimonadaceae bacterium]|nr:hypothetical protein [Fimbriimonadaceae bacterium]